MIALPRHDRTRLRARRGSASSRAGGLILFGGNGPPTPPRCNDSRRQRAAGGDAFVALDQEGGAIRTLAFAPSAVGQARQPTPDGARRGRAATARALRAGGVNVVLGPVADVAAGTTGSVMAGRAWGIPATPRRSRGLDGGARLAGGRRRRRPAKHFPGLGGATVQHGRRARGDRPHAGKSRGGTSCRSAAASEAGVPLVMAGHARYPALDRERIASQSKAVARACCAARWASTGSR